jgi:hypothetical protein
MGKKYGTKYVITYDSTWYENKEFIYHVKANSEKNAGFISYKKLVNEIGERKALCFKVKSIKEEKDTMD